MTVNDFLRSVIVALENQAGQTDEQADETPKKEEQTEEVSTDE